MNSDSSKSRRRRNQPDLTANLSDDILVDILSRLPVKSLCRCKAVSWRWRFLIFHDDHRRKFSRTLPGIFYDTVHSRHFPAEARHFAHVWEGHRRPLVSPSLSFLPGYECATILDCCDGVLLCCFSDESSSHDALRYVVCNPVAKTMLLLPDSGCGANKCRVVRLAFDPALYTEAYVFEFVEDEVGFVVGANIYSSVTGAWKYKESDWFTDARLFEDPSCVFFSGSLHLISGSHFVLVVDVEGDIWSSIPLPIDAKPDCFFPGFIGKYKEHLCYIGEMEGTCDLALWVLEDYYTAGDWTMKHRLSIDMLFGKQLSPCKLDRYDYCVIGILQDCNFILYFSGRTLMAYDIDGDEIHAIQNLEQGSSPPFYLYVPFYTE